MSSGPPLGGTWRAELRDLKRGMNRLAAREVLKPLAKELAAAAKQLGIERASKLMPASTIYARSSPTRFLVGTDQKGAAAHQFGATIRPLSVTAQREAARRTAMAAARMAVGTKSGAARQFVREAGRHAIRNIGSEEIVAYLTFRVSGKWVKVRRVKLPKKELLPLNAVPRSWSYEFERVAGDAMRRLFPHAG